MSEEPHDVLAAEEFGVPAPDPRLHREPAHDVLAAEEFGVPAPDPRLHREPAHDVLAAEEFAMPAPDPSIRAHVTVLPANPADPTGAEPAHDVLAAEEFAMPASLPHAVPPGFDPSDSSPRDYRRLGLIAGSFVLLLVWRRNRRRSSS